MRTGGTLVFLMGVSALPTICAGLLDAGMAPDTPAAVGEDADFSRMVGACIGAQTAAEARKHGIPAAVAREATMDALVELITALRD